MSDHPQLKFLSLFVPDLQEAAAHYREVFGVAPRTDPGPAIAAHPFAAAGPVVFELGRVALALYQCDQQATHPGDVGIGIEVSGAVQTVVDRAGARQGMLIFGPRQLPADGRELAAFMLPDRHFFEVVGPRAPSSGSR